jgi:RNA polymerase sigma-70 factor, ECF subfamily
MVQTAATESDKAQAFQTLFRAELGYVWGSLRRLGVSARDAEDVAHDVFLRVYEKLDAYDPARPLRPWLFGFAYRAASDYRRLARHRVEVIGEDADAPTRGPLADDAIAHAEDVALVAEALDAIDLDRRAVLVAYELDECPMKEIAEAIGIPLHTAYSRLRVAREELAAAVRRAKLRRGETS